MTTQTQVLPFRPLFAGAAGFASLGMLVWGTFLHLGWLPVAVLSPLLWHGHEMLFGFAGALIGGFLLTAAANWTGLRTTTPPVLAMLMLLWLSARIAMFLPGTMLMLAAVLDVAYLLLLALLVGRVVLRADNGHNIYVSGFLLVYAALDAVFFAGAIRGSPLAGQVLLCCVDLLTFLMLAIGGRVIPLFTGRKLSGLHIAERKRVDIAVNLGALLLIFMDIAGISPAVRGAASVALAALVLWRLQGWRSWVCRREPMLWVLHLGYLWLALGLILRGLGLLNVLHLPEVETLHGITVGALGTLSIGMMTRVAQGHSGVDIRANRWLMAAFLLPSVAAALRIAGGPALWPLAAGLWALAFALYLAAIGPLLLRGHARSA